MRAKDVMSKGVMSIMADASVFDAAEILVNEHISALPVVDGVGRIVGIVSEADIIRRAEIGTSARHGWLARLLADDTTRAREFVHSHSRSVRDVMTNKVIVADEDATLGQIAELMERNGIKRIPIVCDGFMVGVVSRANLLQALMSRGPKPGPQQACAASPDAELRQAVTTAIEQQPWAPMGLANVVVDGGIAHLWGFVPNETVRAACRVAAENVPGIKAVRNHLRTTPLSAHLGV